MSEKKFEGVLKSAKATYVQKVQSWERSRESLRRGKSLAVAAQKAPEPHVVQRRAKLPNAKHIAAAYRHQNLSNTLEEQLGLPERTMTMANLKEHIDKTNSIRELSDLRRRFAAANHPDHASTQERERANVDMTIANALIDQAIQRLRGN